MARKITKLEAATQALRDAEKALALAQGAYAMAAQNRDFANATYQNELAKDRKRRQRQQQIEYRVTLLWLESSADTGEADLSPETHSDCDHYDSEAEALADAKGWVERGNLAAYVERIDWATEDQVTVARFGDTAALDAHGIDAIA